MLSTPRFSAVSLILKDVAPFSVVISTVLSFVTIGVKSLFEKVSSLRFTQMLSEVSLKPLNKYAEPSL